MSSNKNTILNSLFKSLIANGINMSFLFALIPLLLIIKDSILAYIYIPLGILNGIIISIIIKKSKDIFFTLVFTIIMFIIICYLMNIVTKLIPPNDFIINLFKNVSFEGFIGHFVMGIIFETITFITLVAALLKNLLRIIK